MSAEYLGTMPRLYGAPSYTRPPRPGIEPQRPFDPDDLPLACTVGDDAVSADASPFSQGFDAMEDQDWFLQASTAPFGPRIMTGGRGRW